MESPLACASCGALGRIPTMAIDAFEMFGLTRTFEVDLDTLHDKYLALSRVIHPDVSVGTQPEQRQQALMLSAELNRAYEMLRDPVTRAEYLLTLIGGPSASDDKSVPGDLLAEVLMLRDEIEEATGVSEDLAAIKERVTQRRAGTLEAISSLARQIDSHDESQRRQLRQQLNTMKYWNNLLGQIPLAGGASDPTNDHKTG